MNSFKFYPKIPFFFIGGCSFIVIANFSSNSLCSLFNLFGVCTITVNTKLPLALEFNDLNPLSLIVNLVPVCVPSGIWNISVLPSTIGIFRLAPNVACVIVIGTSHITVVPCLEYIELLLILTVIYKSPLGPPFSPGSPSPLNTTV